MIVIFHSVGDLNHKQIEIAVDCFCLEISNCRSEVAGKLDTPDVSLERPNDGIRRCTFVIVVVYVAAAEKNQMAVDDLMIVMSLNI